jgi:Tol biopolymer transport system component
MIKTPFMLLTLLVVNSLVVNSLVHAQDPESRPALELPDSDIFLFEFDESNGKLEISKGANITHRLGYDNQPWFTPDSQSLLFSAANVAVDRTDIYEYFIASGETKQVTDSPNQEYSPQLAPDEQTLSFVTDGETANQSIWFTQRGSGVEKWLLSNQSEREPVGYYSWNHRTGYILYWSRYGYSLRLVHETK